MNKLARLELKRNSLKPYHIAVSIISVVIFSFLYLLAIMLFSYPVDRKKILDAKIITVFSYTVISMLLCNGIAFTILGVTESLPLFQRALSCLFYVRLSL